MKPRFYHWILLILCVLFAAIEGVFDVIGGADPSSRAYEVDNIIVRFLGLGLVIFAALIFTRKHWAFIGIIIFFIMSSLEVVVTYQFASPAGHRMPEFLILAANLLIFFGIPTVLLAWLKRVFCRLNIAPKPN